jgi:UDP-GlcNAc:undecaprenyl-phosphate GlcNAc-1-phosphate transferase
MVLYINYFLAFLAAFLLAVVFTLIVKKIAWRRQLVDEPGPERKIHQQPVPLAGGVAIFLAFFAVTFYLAYGTNLLVGHNIALKYIWAIFFGGLLLVIGGVLDDRFNLSATKQLLWPILAVLVVIVGGIGITKVTNPFGGLLYLDQYEWILFWFRGLPYKLTLIADLFTVLWLLGMMFTVKFLDGLDGLASGVGGIGALIIFLLSTATKWWQPDTALLAIILAGACLGFLLFNFHPAKIFLGSSDLFIGFMLGVLAIISGGKIATALLIMGIPILDVAWVILRRVFWEKKNPFKTADKKHLHFRLLDVGFSHRQAVLILYLFSAFFGSLTLFLQSKDKLITLGLIVLLMILLAVWLVLASKKEIKK